MNPNLADWNNRSVESAIKLLLSCCSALRWAEAVTALRPFASEVDLFEAADQQWRIMSETDWLQAFAAHPRIGERKAIHADAKSLTWSQQEQASAASAEAEILTELAELNQQYEEKFGFTYIVCATGKSAGEMLAILKRRLHNDRTQESAEAQEQQRQIMHIRLRKWLEG